MEKNKSFNNEKINWLNYQSNVKNILIRLDTNKQRAALLIDIQYKDEELRLLFYKQFKELKNSFCFNLWRPLEMDKRK